MFEQSGRVGPPHKHTHWREETKQKTTHLGGTASQLLAQVYQSALEEGTASPNKPASGESNTGKSVRFTSTPASEPSPVVGLTVGRRRVRSPLLLKNTVNIYI